MTSSIVAWFLLLMLGVLLMICGFQGSLGRVLAVVFVPGDLVVDSGDGTATGKDYTASTSATKTPRVV